MPICSKCKINRPVNKFIKNGRTLKSCQICREGGMPIKRPVIDDVDDTVDDDDIESVESESDESESVESDDSNSESDESESDESESESDETESIVCEACNKEFYDEISAFKHSKTASHKKKWYIFHENQ